MKTIEDTIKMTQKESDFIARFTAKNCKPHSLVMEQRLRSFVDKRQMEMLMASPAVDILAAGSRDGSSNPSENEVRSPKEPVRFVFAAKDESWCAEVIVPPQAEVTSDLTVIVSNRNGETFQDGVFEIAGQRLHLESGRATLQFGLFLAGIRKAEVVFTPTLGEAVSGRLMFF